MFKIGFINDISEKSENVFIRGYSTEWRNRLYEIEYLLGIESQSHLVPLSEHIILLHAMYSVNKFIKIEG